ncbi:uncharacterized protein MELLADRAFT_124012 [Melampsora larici-populina 98AG31]|uniref:Secreted protein n=1 Tax=Melampsora larici-populina (strain 98AG31 / pathotype 3-4-7) TaxID=747676 RepID=F4RMB7_MELLP|nr:uncharacterized protein MELLADRAFT_124012 [Melampsora larici-populina 98AG31]EGG06500.1 hypothetical protein MELLADRAFT_124012 [Melampsora larici-populina 98AG31]
MISQPAIIKGSQIFTIFNLIFLLSLSSTQSQNTGGDVPLAGKRFPWPNLPYQADTGSGVRGTQYGYNICNATTQTPDSRCQTAWLDSIDGFCLWGAQAPNSVVGDIEGETVAYCTKKKYGARMIPAGAIQGIQLTRTPGYIQIVGQIDQTALNIKPDDAGGELDPHGADLRGNPLGGLVYSTAFGKNGQSSKPIQVIEWSSFIGSNIFCFKACDPAGPDAARLCEHIYDRVGCEYNMPANYTAIAGTFQACRGENQLPVGVYIENGVQKVWPQPPESAGIIKLSDIPYKPLIPTITDCQSYDPATLFNELPVAPATPKPSAISTPTPNGGQTVPLTNNTGITNSPSASNTLNSTSSSNGEATDRQVASAKSDGAALVFSNTITLSLFLANFIVIGFSLVP